ncbi:OmpA family protein [Thalassococcus sp. CAU 1522]|uniref:OmpA family protein n=1 Tax=Thalassococcus arenae TaxID=2851652 RepID=A0ABS6N485_9RHOB|nr:OmpA family protein [Thalassococcus arenae]MBV2358835.1 OmpA family protein [Thalassococcus arenae]
MRDFLAILVIVAAVVGFGVFTVPSDEPLINAGIRAEAARIAAASEHPLSVAVADRIVTVEGSVESADDMARLVQALSGIDGVAQVENRLALLDAVRPFVVEAIKDGSAVAVTGFASGVDLAEELGRALRADVSLPVASGAPDAAWGSVALRGAQALAQMIDGRMRLRDRVLEIEGRVLLPGTAAALRAGFELLPEHYFVRLSIQAVDDGRPYSLLISRDRRMGQRVTGKVPPDFDLAVLAPLGPLHGVAIDHAPLPLIQPGFEDALALSLPVFAHLTEGQLALGPGTVSLVGGLADPAIAAQAEALHGTLPPGFSLNLSLVPPDPGPDLALRLDRVADGVVATGHVPSDFDLAALAAAIGLPVDAAGVTRGPYPDLDGWSTTLLDRAPALGPLSEGVLILDAAGARLDGVAPNPDAAARVEAAMQGADVVLAVADDGAPPDFTVSYDAATGAQVEGKLMRGLSVAALAEALGVEPMRGAPRLAPGGDGDTALAALAAMRPYLAEVETLRLHATTSATVIAVTLTPRAPIDRLEPMMRRALPLGVALDAATAPPPPSGTRRQHAHLNVPQIFSDGYWLPDLGAVPEVEGCTAALATLPAIRFDTGSFVLEPGTMWPLASLAGLVRACTAFRGLVLEIEGQAASSSLPALNRQLSRRRAEAVADALVARGVDPAMIETTGAGDQGSGDRLVFRWK